MKNIVKAKQKRTIIVSLILCAVLLIGSLYVIVDEIIHINAAYKQFDDINFAKAYAYSLGYNSYRDLSQSDLDKVESLRCYIQVGYDENKVLYVNPVVELGFKEQADAYLGLLDEEDKENESSAAESALATAADTSATTADQATSDEAAPKNYVSMLYLVKSADDLSLFKNLRVLYLYDNYDISQLQTDADTAFSTYYNDYIYASMSGGEGSYTGYITYDQLVYGDDENGINSIALTDLTSLEQISSLTKLEHLSLEYTGITSLDGIEAFPNLTNLDIGYTSAMDIDAIASATNIEKLVMTNMGKNVKPEEATADNATSDSATEDEHVHEGLEDISAIAPLTKLEYLNVMNNAIEDISALKDMAELQYLYINSNCVEDLNSLAGKTKMTAFSAADNHISDISGIADSVDLVGVDIRNNSIKDLAPMGKFAKLEMIYASENEIETLGDLSGMKALKTVDVFSNKLTSLKGIENCTEITTINAYDNKITDIGDLSKLDNLTSISVYNNEIKDLNGLNGCAKLQTISAYDNKLEGDLVLKDCPELTALNIYVTEVTDDTTTKDVVETTVKGKLNSIDVSGLKKLTNISAYNQAITSVNIKDCVALTGINLYGNQLTSVPNIAGCVKLVTITLNDNKITDVSNLATDMDSKKDGINTIVTNVNLSGNAIADISVLKDVKSLTTLNLAKNKITDITAIGSLTSLKTLTLTDNAGIASLDAISNNFATTSSLSLDIVGTEAAKNTSAIEAMQKKFSTMQITYKATTTENK